MTRLYQPLIRLGETIPYAFLALFARIAGAVPFWRSGQSKLDSSEIFGVKWNIFSIHDRKVFLFQEQFGFPEAIAPAATHLAALGEFFLPLLLITGLFTRMGALGLLIMTAVIQFYVFPGELLNPNGNWSMHLLWATPLFLIFARGPGAISLDAILGKKFNPNES